MLDISSSLAARHFASRAYRIQPAPPSRGGMVRSTEIVYLSDAARRLSSELQAIDADDDRDPRSREEALARLRRLQASLNGETV